MPCPICDQKPMNCDCTQEERRMYAEIEELREQVPQWISVDERLPAKNETLLVMCDVGVTAGSYSPAMKEWWAMSASADGMDQNQTVTHWMPLPAPPDAE